MSDEWSHLLVYFMQPGFSRQRLNIFNEQLKKLNAKVCSEITSETSHILVNGKETARFGSVWSSKLLKLSEQNDDVIDKVIIADSDWLSKRLVQKQVVDCEPFLVELLKEEPKPEGDETTAFSESPPKRQKLAESLTSQILTQDATSFLETCPEDAKFFNGRETSFSHIKTSQYSDYDDSDNDVTSLSKKEQDSAVQRLMGYDPKVLPKSNWVCTQSSVTSKNGKAVPVSNKQICAKLEQMVNHYEVMGDKWRVYAYRKAIGALKVHGGEIETFEQACSIPGVGRKIGEKVWEIVEKGSFTKLDNMNSDDKLCTMNLFMNVHGVGAKIAESWYSLGYRTLEQVTKNAKNLTSAQKVGLELYDDLIDRMPREEVTQIESVVREIVLEVNSNAICQVCGSYRRGQPTCGDIDFLITTKDGVSHSTMMGPLLQELHRIGFLTHDLVTVSVESVKTMRKYMGVCKLQQPNSKHRRIDIICMPLSEYPCAVVYFTGSAYFNRSLRLLAQRRGMSLNEHSLIRNVTRNGSGQKQGEIVNIKSEQELFAIMGVPFRPPHERDW